MKSNLKEGDTVHGKYSPSRLNFLSECSGWISGPPSDMAERGTLVHDTLHRLIDGRSIPKGRPTDVLELAEVGFEYYKQLVSDNPGYVWHPEQSVSTGIAECYGTSDLIGYDEFSGSLLVIDWKTGRGTRSDAAKSWQMKAYAAAALHKYPADTVTMQVIELETKESTQAIFDASDAVQWLDEIKAIIAQAKVCTPVDYWPFSGCKYCGRDNCPAIQSLTIRTISDVATLPIEPTTLPPEVLAPMLDKYLPAFDLVESYIGKLKSRAMALIEQGIDVPGWIVAERAGIRKWIDEEQAAESLPKEINNEIWKLKSPADIEKALVTTGIKKKEASAILKPLTAQGINRTLKQAKAIKEAV